MHPEIAPLQAQLCCGPRSTEQSTSRGGEEGEKVLRKEEEEEGQTNDAQKKI